MKGMVPWRYKDGAKTSGDVASVKLVMVAGVGDICETKVKHDHLQY